MLVVFTAWHTASSDASWAGIPWDHGSIYWVSFRPDEASFGTMLLLLQPLSSMPNRSTTFYLTALRRAEGPLQLSCKLSKQALLPLASFLVVKQKVIRSQTESQQHTPLTQILDNVALNSQIVIQPTEQPINSQPNKRTTRSQITSHYHHATQAFTQKTTPPIQHINIINPITYQVKNNPTLDIADH